MEAFTLRTLLNVLNPQEEDMDKPIYVVLLEDLYIESQGGEQGVSPRQMRKYCAKEVVAFGVYRYFEDEIGLGFGFASDICCQERPPEEEEDASGFPTGDDEEAEDV